MSANSFMVTNRQYTPTGPELFNNSPQSAGALSWCVWDGSAYGVCSDPTTFFEKLDVSSGELTVFIHGLDTDWNGASSFTTKVAGNLAGTNTGFSSSYTGTVIGYSWPSTTEVQDYLQDRANIRASSESFANFVSTLQSQLPAGTKISIIAHSEGNYMMKVGADAISGSLGVVFDQILLVAPDLPEDCFADGGYATSIPQVCASVTTYFNNFDQVLLEAGMVMKLADDLGETLNRELFPDDYQNWYPTYDRLGNRGIPSLLETASSNVLEINCSLVDGVGSAAHTNYFEDAQIVADIGAALSGTAPTEIANRVTLPLTEDREFLMWPASDDSLAGTMGSALLAKLPVKPSPGRS